MPLFPLSVPGACVPRLAEFSQKMLKSGVEWAGAQAVNAGHVRKAKATHLLWQVHGRAHLG